jgi:hypothetical protein
VRSNLRDLLGYDTYVFSFAPTVTETIKPTPRRKSCDLLYYILEMSIGWGPSGAGAATAGHFAPIKSFAIDVPDFHQDAQLCEVENRS